MAITTLGHIGAGHIGAGHIGTVRAMDEAFADAACHLIAANGTVRLLDVHQWREEADGNDLRLFVDQCRGATLDIGCGPGRLAAALTARSIPTMGIDVSIEAIRQTRDRGAVAIRRDVFSTVPAKAAGTVRRSPTATSASVATRFGCSGVPPIWSGPAARSSPKSTPKEPESFASTCNCVLVNA